MIVNGQRINSCLTLAVMHAGDEITTIEGLEIDGDLHPMQAAFVRHDGLQCGYCPPGQICSAIGVRPKRWTVSCGCFDRLPGVVILELCWA